MALYFTGAPAEAVRTLEALSSNGAQPRNLAPLGFVYGRLGRTADARCLLGELTVQADANPSLWYFAVEVAAGFGDRVTTLDYLQRARNARSANVVLRVLCDPRFDILTPDERRRLTRPPA